ncbi:Uncharacterised protein [Mycobacteroides abscessus subsp. abscessus]|nr:Uncharacterised protein [Mycobacteroides abscessus subsp. abscessus]SKU98449.1 Uncharacterised protein [Mycobacteroides abscessus subsp. abscessus]
MTSSSQTATGQYTRLTINTTAPIRASPNRADCTG